MKINVVMGFFLPVPPDSGGATEKTWHRLALEFTARGHEVTLFSREWRNWPKSETLGGVRYQRIPGFDHRRKLWQNLALDFIWSLRAHRRLPPADIAVIHTVALPVWLGALRPAAGRVVVMPGRMPKGQYQHYHRIARVLATSTPVRDKVVAENPSLAAVTKIYGYPIGWQTLARPRATPASPTVTLGFAGRLHPEKGVDLLVDAALRLQSDTTLPRWRLLLCGPDSVMAGGGGENFRLRLEGRLRRGLADGQWSIRPALNREEALADFYRSLDVFCYPSLADGETFGVSIAEAMAAGAAPVVSDLACFRDFVRPGINGLTFDHHGPEASHRLADALAQLIRDPAQRRSLSAAAQAEVQRYDFARYADALVEDFKALTAVPR